MPDGNTYHADAKSKDTSTIVKNTDGSYTRTTTYRKVYKFNASGKLIQIVDKNGNLTTLTYTGNDLTRITDRTGRYIDIGVSGGKIQYVKDYSGKSFTITYLGNVLHTVSDPLGNTWRYEYYPDNKMYQKFDPNNNPPTTYVYDATTGKLTSSTDPDGLSKNIAYDAENAITYVTEKDGGQWVHKYYAEFNVPWEITDPLGKKTTYAYYPGNKLQSVTYPDSTSTSYTYYSSGDVETRTDARGKTTSFSYYSDNRLQDIQDPAGGTIHFTYDANGNLSSYSDPGNPTGQPTRIERDVKGNILKITDPLSHYYTYEYDDYDNLKKVTDPTGIFMTFTSDVLGHVHRMEDALGHGTGFYYDDQGQLLTDILDQLGNVTSFTHDGNGNIDSITDPRRNLTTFTYSYRGQLKSRTDDFGHVTTFSYVPTGCSPCSGGGEKLTSATDSVQPVGSTTHFQYDQRGFLDYVEDPLHKITTWAYDYDVNRRRVTRTDRNNVVLAYDYTPSWKLDTVTYPDQTFVKYSYDDLDRLYQVNDLLGTSKFTYDGAGRVTGYTDPYTAPEGFTLSYVYDDAGNLRELHYPDGSRVTYEYDAANRLKSVKNWLDQENYEQAAYDYDEAGRPRSFTQFNGIVTTYAFDEADRFTGMESTVASYVFTLDANGNRIESVQAEPLTATPPAGSGSTAYEYNDRKNRLLSAGNLTYTYDDEGQLIAAGDTAYTFDHDYRLTGIHHGSSDQFFSYDGIGNRLLAVRDGVTTRYIYDHWGNVLAEADESNRITRKYIYGKGLIAVAASSARYCYHFNGTGSTVALTDMSRAIVNKYAYDPFGQLLAEQESVPQPFKFVGRYGVMAEQNGLYYMRARYYDPSVGRFISEDPLGFGGGDVNLFAYVGNDPVNSIDPLGLLTVHIWDYRGSGVAWGHASITLENGTHMSWWPQATGRQSVKLFPQIYSVDAYQNQTFQDDIAYEGQNPDKDIRIFGLDEAAIERWWNDFQSKNQWKTLSQNCSTTSAEALKAGGADVLWRDFFTAHYMVWTPTDVEAYAGAINRYLEGTQ